MTVVIDGTSLTIADVVKVARRSPEGFAKVALDRDARARLAETRAFMEENWLSDTAPLVYGMNTGSGAFKNDRIAAKDFPEAQRRKVLGHATGMGEPFGEDVVRAMLLLRANAVAQNNIGIRPEIADRLVDFLNAELVPVVPEKGSVGTSGDLAPGAHMGGAVFGYPEAEIFYKGARMRAADAIQAAGLQPQIAAAARDSSALIGGSAASLALACLFLHDARRLLKTAAISLALSMEAMRAEVNAFDPNVHRARPHPGQELVARNVMRIIAGSGYCTSEARNVVFPGESRAEGVAAPPRLQDVYSLRCAPQVHGPVADALDYIEKVIAIELNASQDNPVIFSDGNGGYRALNSGHFHAQYLAQVGDIFGIALADLGVICERRLARLVEPTMSYGLPRNLVAGQAGFNTGYGTVQCSMSALVMENRHLATPGSVDSIPGKGNVEDHVSNSTWCCRKARMILDNVQRIVGGELLMAAQAISLVEPRMDGFCLGAGSRAAYETLRKAIPAALDGDRWYADDMDAAYELVLSDGILDAVENAIGPLE